MTVDRLAAYRLLSFRHRAATMYEIPTEIVERELPEALEFIAATTPTPDPGAIFLPREPSEAAIFLISEAMCCGAEGCSRLEGPDDELDQRYPCVAMMEQEHARAAYAALVKHLEDKQT